MNVQPIPTYVDASPKKVSLKKRYVRKPTQIRVEVERGQQGLEAQSLNISPSGICLELEEPLEDDEKCRVLLYIPRGKEVEILKVSARMVWQRMLDDGRWRVGASFMQFAPGDAKRIVQWLLAQPASAQPTPEG